MQLLLKYDKRTCQDYHGKNFDEYDFNRKLVYRISRIATFETKIRIFLYNLHNKKFFHFDIITQFKKFMKKHRSIFFMNALT